MFAECMVVLGRLCEASAACALGILMMGVCTLVTTPINQQQMVDALLAGFGHHVDAGMRERPRMETVTPGTEALVSGEAEGESVAPPVQYEGVRVLEPLDTAIHHQVRLLKVWGRMVINRLERLGAVVAMALPLGLAWWMAGRRQSFQALHQGTPVRDATRVRWIRMSVAIALALGVVTGLPHVPSLTEVMALLVIAECAALSRTRASSAAALGTVEPA